MKWLTLLPPATGLKYNMLEYGCGPPMVNLADLPSIDGVDWFSVMVETAVPSPAAQICPSRPEPAGNTAEHDCHPGNVWLSLIVVLACPVTFHFPRVPQMYP